MEQEATCTECEDGEIQVKHPCVETIAVRCPRCSRVKEIGWIKKWLFKDTLIIHNLPHFGGCPEGEEEEDGE